MAVSLCLMRKNLKIQPISFTNTKFFPGCAGNPFDRLLHSLEKIEKMPSLVMNILLIAFALLGGLPELLKTHNLPLITGALALFFIVDWILIALLPETRSSFGMTKITVLMLALLRVPFALLPSGWNIGFEVAGTLLVIYGFYIEPFWIEIRHETLTSQKIASGKSIKILHLGDLHLERTTRREKKLLALVKELQPDLILFSGDVLNLSYLNDTQAKANAVDFFKQLNAPMGVYGVSGSPAVDFPALMAKLNSDTPLQWLNNSVATLEIKGQKINLVGITCTHHPDKDEQTLAALLKDNEVSGFNLLLYHSPDLAPNASRHDIDLQLSGHTHGGQVRLPLIGALYTGSLYGRIFDHGRYLVNGMPLYITRGLGMEGAIAPRVRFLCRPEITLWEIKSK